MMSPSERPTADARRFTQIKRFTQKNTVIAAIADNAGNANHLSLLTSSTTTPYA
jgi:hypothetical protein